MNALLLLVAAAFAEPNAYQQAVDCKEGRCWGKTSPGSAVYAQSSDRRPNLSFSASQKAPKSSPPPLGAAAEEKPGMLSNLGSGLKALGAKAMEYAPNLIGAGLLGALGMAFAGPWGLLAGAIIGWMIPGLLKKASAP